MAFTAVSSMHIKCEPLLSDLGIHFPPFDNTLNFMNVETFDSQTSPDDDRVRVENNSSPIKRARVVPVVERSASSSNGLVKALQHRVGHLNDVLDKKEIHITSLNFKLQTFESSKDASLLELSKVVTAFDARQIEFVADKSKFKQDIETLRIDGLQKAVHFMHITSAFEADIVALKTLIISLSSALEDSDSKNTEMRLDSTSRSIQDRRERVHSNSFILAQAAVIRTLQHRNLALGALFSALELSVQ